MADVKEMRIFCAEQIEVPETLPDILKNYSKAVIRANPENIISFSRKYFEDKKAEMDKNKKESEATLDVEAKKP
jgi:predicted hydrocarbon binding protein